MFASAHIVLAWVVVFGNGAVGLWAVAAHFVESVRGRALWVCVAVMQALLFVEVAIGVVRLNQIGGDPPEFHTLYGFLCLVAVAILYGYRSQLGEHRYLMYGGGSLFIMGLAIRAMTLEATPVAALV